MFLQCWRSQLIDTAVLWDTQQAPVVHCGEAGPRIILWVIVLLVACQWCRVFKFSRNIYNFVNRIPSNPDQGTFRLSAIWQNVQRKLPINLQPNLSAGISSNNCQARVQTQSWSTQDDSQIISTILKWVKSHTRRNSPKEKCKNLFWPQFMIIYDGEHFS